MRLYGTPPRTFEKPGELFPDTKIKFEREARPYKVICDSKRYTIVTKPLNIHHTVLYTIIDWQEQVRGPEDLIFGMGAETREQCLEMLVRLLDDQSEVSHRHRIWLDIEKIWADDHIMYGEGAETFEEWLDRKTAKRKATPPTTPLKARKEIK